MNSWQGPQTGASHQRGFGAQGTCPVSLVRKDAADSADTMDWGTLFQSGTVRKLNEFLNSTVLARWMASLCWLELVPRDGLEFSTRSTVSAVTATLPVTFVPCFIWHFADQRKENKRTEQNKKKRKKEKTPIKIRTDIVCEQQTITCCCC